MRQFTLGLALATALCGAASAASTNGASLTLQAGTAERVIIDGAIWKCAESQCTAASVKGMPALRSCKRVVEKLGAVSAFTFKGQALSEDQIAECNTAAKAA